MLSQDQIKERIFKYVANNPGCTNIQLAIRSDIIRDDHSLDIPDLLEGLVDNKDLVEIEYVLPTPLYGSKSIYFPKGSDVSALIKKDDSIDILYNLNVVCSFPSNTEVEIRGI